MQSIVIEEEELDSDNEGEFANFLMQGGFDAEMEQPSTMQNTVNINQS